MTILRLCFPNFQYCVRGAGDNSMVAVLKVLEAWWNSLEFEPIYSYQGKYRRWEALLPNAPLRLRASNHSVPVPTLSLTHCLGLGQSTASWLASCCLCRKLQVVGQRLSEAHVTHTYASSARNALRNVKVAHHHVKVAKRFSLWPY